METERPTSILNGKGKFTKEKTAKANGKGKQDVEGKENGKPVNKGERIGKGKWQRQAGCRGHGELQTLNQSQNLIGKDKG